LSSYIRGMTRQQALRRGVAALAVASLVSGTELALTGPAVAGGHHHYGNSYSYSYGGYRPYFGSHYRYPYGYRHNHNGYRYSRHGHSGVGIHGHGSGAAVAVVALGAGLLLGYLLTRSPRAATATTPSPALTRAQSASPTFGYGKRVAPRLQADQRQRSLPGPPRHVRRHFLL